jgi:hypothetical protein
MQDIRDKINKICTENQLGDLLSFEDTDTSTSIEKPPLVHLQFRFP